MGGRVRRADRKNRHAKTDAFLFVFGFGGICAELGTDVFRGRAEQRKTGANIVCFVPCRTWGRFVAFTRGIRLFPRHVQNAADLARRFDYRRSVRLHHSNVEFDQQNVFPQKRHQCLSVFGDRPPCRQYGGRRRGAFHSQTFSDGNADLVMGRLHSAGDCRHIRFKPRGRKAERKFPEKAEQNGTDRKLQRRFPPLQKIGVRP